MTIYDAAMAIVVVAGMVRGAWLGITWQLASIASLILGYVVSHQASAQFAPYFPGEPEVARSLAMAAIYVVVSASVFGLARLVREILHKIKFEAYDRHLGMLLGGSEAACVGMLVTMFVVSLAPATRQPIFSSPTGHVVGIVMNNLGPVLPGEVRKVLAPHWDADSGSLVAGADGSIDESSSRSAHQADAASGAKEGSPPDATQYVPAASRAKAPAGLSDLPLLEAAPGNDAALQRARGPSLGSVLQEGRQEVEQAVAETLDLDPNHKATNLRQLVNKDRQKVKGALKTLSTDKRQAGSQVKDRLSRGKQQLEQAISDSVTKGTEQVEQTITDSIDQELRRMGGLAPAPQDRPR
jgi:membrane protein required for colicin V production